MQIAGYPRRGGHSPETLFCDLVPVTEFVDADSQRSDIGVCFVAIQPDRVNVRESLFAEAFNRLLQQNLLKPEAAIHKEIVSAASFRAYEARRAFGIATPVMWPSRPSAQRQCTKDSKSRRFDLLLDDFEVARRVALLNPID
jgi:hypothetical protein